METRLHKIYFVVLLLLPMISVYCANEVIDVNASNVTHRAYYNITELDMPQGLKHCRLYTQDKFVYNKIRDLIASKVKLINYNITFPNYTVNPLTVGIKWGYKADKWSRVSNQHGQTLLSLAFNYGVMSLMTLTFGIEQLDINLIDSPVGCFGELTENDKLESIMFVMSRDFQEGATEIALVKDEGICHQIILDVGGAGKFKNKCCRRDRITNEFRCTTDIGNIYLRILYIILAMVRVGLLFCGPILFVAKIVSLGEELVPYVVKLKEPLYKNIYLSRPGTPTNIPYKHVLDLRTVRKFRKFKDSISDMPVGEIIPIEIWQYDILVDYKQLLTENTVPVGLTDSLSKTIFQCTIRDIGPFKSYCSSNIFRSYPSLPVIPWFSFWEKIGKLLALLLLPTPLYIRILVFYLFEAHEISERKQAVEEIGLKVNYENNLIHYLTPSHPVFICIYALYFITALTMTHITRRAHGTQAARFHQIVLGSFADHNAFSYIASLRMVVSNFVWPLKRFGILGVPLALIYWPIVMPLSVLVYAAYCMPTVYLTVRMLIRSRAMPCKAQNKNTTDDHGYRMHTHVDNTLDWFDIEKLMSRRSAKRHGRATNASRRVGRPESSSTTKTCQQLLVALLCIVTMYGTLIVASECLGFVIEVIIFTLMGIIANAGSMLKYCTLVFLVILYSYDTFNNVPKKYLKLNKALFSEVKSRISDLDKVTSLPSYLQENFGFKSCENSEQADYESPDDLSSEFPRHWFINDLVLFIDNEDMPRIPRELFDGVCSISVAGSPGPVYKGLLEATQEFLRIVMFLLLIFVVVLSFGTVYRVSSTNQTMATLAGGFLPFILRTFMAPSKPEIELGTVSFKSKLDEIIINFYQQWIMYDFPLKLRADNESLASHSTTAAADVNSNRFPAIDQPDSAVVPSTLSTPTNKTANNAIFSETPTYEFNKQRHGQDMEMQHYTAVDTSNVSETPDVDILIHLPEYTSEGWLAEWSDISDYDEPNNDNFDDDDDVEGGARTQVI